ncbi:MAG: hypothetical protein ACRCTZ_15035 [Sarcina sp.]
MYNYGYNFTQPGNLNPYQQNQQNQNQLQKIRYVNSMEEVRNAYIDIDGSTTIFIDSSNNMIYTKQINMTDGTLMIKEYKQIEQMKNEEKYVTRQEFEELKNMLGGVEK